MTRSTTLIFGLLTALLFTFGMSAEGHAAEAHTKHDSTGIREGETLSLQRCVEIAVKNQPGVIAASGNITAAESKVRQASSSDYPQVNASTGYSRIAPATAKSTDYNQYSAGIAVNQNIYDFGRTETQVSLQKANVQGVRADLDNTMVQITYSVKQAYYALLQAVRNKSVAEETVKQYQQHLEQAKGFFEVGTKPKFDVIKAEVDLSNAKLNLIKTNNAIKIAKTNLNNAMGMPRAPEYQIEDNLAFNKYPVVFEEALKRALENRPDLKSLASKRKSAELALELAKKGQQPTITGTAGYSISGQKFPLYDGWNVGVSLSASLFNGHLTKNQVEEAEANLGVIKANEELLKQTVYLEVEQACLNLVQAESTIPAAEIAVKQATENLEIASGRYAAGVGNPVEVTDAQVLYTNAKMSYIQALSDYRTAVAGIEKAMGSK